MVMPAGRQHVSEPPAGEAEVDEERLEVRGGHVAGRRGRRRRAEGRMRCRAVGPGHRRADGRRLPSRAAMAGGGRQAGSSGLVCWLAGWPALLLCRSGGRVGVGHHGDNPLRRRVGIARSMSARKEPKDCWKRRRPREWRLSSRGSSSGNTVESHMDRLKQWVTMGIALLVLGIILHFSHAIPLNKQLYTFSYICVTAGAAGVVFSVFYFLVDILNLRYLFAPLQWIGMNAMLVYVMAAEGIFEGFLNGWYYEGTNNTLVYWVRRHVFVRVWRSARVGILLYVIFAQIFFWALVAGLLHRAGLYWKL